MVLELFRPHAAPPISDTSWLVNLTDKDELYDLENDPFEMSNLIDDDAHASPRNELHSEIIAWMNRTRDPFRGHSGLIANGMAVQPVVGEALRDRDRKMASIRIRCYTIRASQSTGWEYPKH